MLQRRHKRIPWTYNYYVQDSPAPGKGPFSFRVTATGGQQFTDSGIVLSPSQVVTGTQQF